MSGQIDTTIQQVRKISTELRPGVLDDLGLGAAIEWQANEFRQRMGIECEVVLEDIRPEAVSPAKATAVFRILQELLTNVVRHAEASKVVIELGIEDGWLCLCVRDNGRGIRRTEVEAADSLGILGMRERAAVFGGSLEFEGDEETGTTATVRIPSKEMSHEISNS
jgi:signal transduction histidine kinase